MPGPSSVPQGLWLPPRTSTLFVAASNASDRSKAQADYICTGVNDHVEIQGALDALPATGGEVRLSEGTFYIEVSLVLDTNQTLRGQGKGTVLTTTTANLNIITATGTSGSEKTGILIADLCIDGDLGGVANDIGIRWEYVDYSKIRNVWSQDNGEYGIGLLNSDFNEIIGNTCKGNTDAGIRLVTSDGNSLSGNTCESNTPYGIRTGGSNNTISGNTCIGNTDGIVLDGAANNNTISGNTCQGNTEYGIRVLGDNNTITGNTCTDNDSGGTLRSGIWINGADECVVAGNQCEGNGLHGIYIYFSSHCTVSGNVCNNQNTGDGINVTGGLTNADYNIIMGNTCYNNASNGIEIAGGANANRNAVQANYLSGNTGAALVDAGTLTQVYDDNEGIEITDVKVYRTVKNTSGGALAAGDVVILKAVAAGNEVTTTTTQGDDKVYGMVAEAIANNASGYVQVKGKTTALKVNGTVDIAIGDPLGTYTAAGIAMKAAAGDQAFAIALEGYTTDDSAGVIDAYLKSPWD